MTHALERTSPRGGPFIGRCIKCGAKDLGMVAALKDCPADTLVSNEAAFIQAIRAEHD